MSLLHDISNLSPAFKTSHDSVRAKDMLLDFLIFSVEGLAGETLKVVPELCFDRVFMAVL
jgi:hypothetical protein